MSDIFMDSEGHIIRNSMIDEHSIVKITEKTPDAKNIGKVICGETNSNILTFEINRFYDNVDLKEKNIKFIIKTPSFTFEDYASNVQHNSNILRFSWLIPYSATQEVGTVEVAIEFFNESYSLKTLPFNIKIEKSISTDDMHIEVPNNWYIDIESRVLRLENGGTGNSGSTATAPSGMQYITTPQGVNSVASIRDNNGTIEYTKNGTTWKQISTNTNTGGNNISDADVINIVERAGYIKSDDIPPLDGYAKTEDIENIVSEQINDYFVENPVGSVSDEHIEQIFDNRINECLSKSEYTKAIAFGTSLTYRCQNENSKGGYMQIISDGLGLDSYVNAGYDGNPFAYGTANGDGISRKIQNTDISSYDLITIEGGTNDFKLNIELGDVGKMGDTNFDNTTTCGALRQAIEYIYANNPTAKIILITDPQRNNANYDVNYINSAGYKLIDYTTAIIKIGQMYGIPVCDWYHLSGFNNLTLSVYTSDGLHPNALGYEVLGKIALSTIKNTPNIFIIESNGDETDIETVNINGVEYNISVAQGYTYKIIMMLGGNYYMYASNNPIYVYDDTTYSETFYKDTVRYSLTNNTFGTPAGMIDYPDTIIQIENTDFYKMIISRDLSSYLWTSHDLKYYSNGEVAINKTE